jgi:hypothetical protein
MNTWVKIAEDTYQLLIEGGSLIRFMDPHTRSVAMVFVPG